MASWLNKWLLAAFLPFFLYTPANFQGSVSSKPALEPHPFHVSVVEINHNATDKIFEISCKIFTDDFENALAKNYKTKVDLINPPDRKKVDTLIKKYIGSHLSVRADNRPVFFTYLGFEHETDATYCYLQVDGIASVKKIGISNKIMHDFFNDQINLMHVTVGGKRKSTKLDYPSTEAEFVF